MDTYNLFNRGFILSLTISLFIHLIALLVILFPSGVSTNGGGQLPSQDMEDEGAPFSPALLINYSEATLQKGLRTVREKISSIPKSKTAWEKLHFQQTLQSTLENLGVNTGVVTIIKSSLDHKEYSINIRIKSKPESILTDCLLSCYTVGIATKRSNFKSNSLHFRFISKGNQIINAKISTKKCRLFVSQRINAPQLLQLLDIS